MDLQLLNSVQPPTFAGNFPTAERLAAEQSFLYFLQKHTAPLLDWSGFSLGYFSKHNELICIVGASCDCEEMKNSQNENLKRHYEKQVLFGGENLGTVILCCPFEFSGGDYYLRLITEYSVEEMSRIEDETALLSELGMSWESLQAIYDLTADLSAFQNPQKLLEKITERATSIGDETRAVLWLENGESLVPITSANILGLDLRRKNFGLIGEAFTQKRSIICDNVAKIKFIAKSERELQNAVRLAVFPIATPLKNYGVLAVWQDNENSIFDSRTTRLLDTLALQAAMIIETERLHRESIANEKLQQEIEIGSNIQQILLNGNLPDEVRGVKISAITIPSKQIDGDFYDFIEYGEDCFDLLVGDVMGKGIPAALVGAATKNYFLRAVSQMQSFEQHLPPSPEEIVGWVNSEVTAKLMQFESFVTACYARFDLVKNVLTFVDCGHTKTLLYSRRDNEMKILEGDNMPLGFSEREIFKEQTVRVEPGDFVFFFSDGITETRGKNGEFYGDARLSNFIYRNSSQEPKKMIADLLKELQEFSGEKNFNDDLTCVAVRVETVSEIESKWKVQLMIDSDLRVLSRARQFVRKVVQLLFIDEVKAERIEEFELAINEAVTNIILHAYQNKKGNQIDIIAENCGDELKISLIYVGESFDPNSVSPPSFDGSRDGGFGMFIISSCVDKVEYLQDSNNRNIICLTKKLRGN